MNQYKLKSRTIIPHDLYVERTADRQLQEIIRDMGRPGYVLVARQMGKTNLLLNAKRKLSDSDTSFCYLDVSNFVPDLRTFFRTLVDTCIDSFPQRFESASTIIADSRIKTASLLPHKEHELELRQLLQKTSGKLIICLDEIDALTKTDYSDQVFSLIRSIYFSGRTNFEEFERLTYILSGVAEPTEIIKNRAISPFNIGEKIYLEDFSAVETKAFIDAAGLDMSEEVRSRIYYWTGGNPRCTWDLCAAIERSVESVTLQDHVDLIVQRLYLTSFDLPPVDHIRSLASSDREIRQAVVQLGYEKSDSISDAVKTRLYLAGITSQGDDGSIRIKNRILEEALSRKWIEDVDQSALSGLELATKLLKEKKYAAALEAFKAVEDSAATIPHLDIYCYDRGVCEYNNGDFASALATFARAPIKRSQSSELFRHQALIAGLCHLMLNKAEEAIASLKTATDKALYEPDAPLPIAYFQGLINLSSAQLRSDTPDYEAAELQCREVIEQLRDPADFPREELDDVLRAAHYNLFALELRKGNLRAAENEIDQALAVAAPRHQVGLILEKTKKFSSVGSRLALLQGATRVCIDEGVRFDALKSQLGFSEEVAAALLVELLRHGESARQTVKDLVDYLASSSFNEPDAVFNVFLRALYSSGGGNSKIVDIVLPMIIDLPTAKPLTADRRHFITAAALVASPDQIEAVGSAFLEEVVDTEHFAASSADARALHRFVRHILAAQKHELASRVIATARSAMERIKADEVESSSERSLFEAVLQILELEISEDKPVGEVLNAYAVVNALATSPETYCTDDFKAHLIQRLVRFAPGAFVPKPMHRTEPKVGRNQLVTIRWKDGSETTGKLKKFLDAIEEGEASVVAVL